MAPHRPPDLSTADLAAVPESLGEFGRIARFFTPLATDPDAFGLTDDAALLRPTPGRELVVTVDAMVEGVHFLPDDPADLVARKLLRVNLSDLAAMAAVPVGYVLTTALPAHRDDAWLAGFAQGLALDQASFGIRLLGGDSVSTPGPVMLTVTAFGEVELGRAVRRNGARPGDFVWVTGTIGDGALGLLAATGRLSDAPRRHQDFLADRYRLPQPRSTLGPALAGLATAMLDISDGLAGDLGHIAQTSGVAAEIDAAAVPLSAAASAVLAADPTRLSLVLSGGDDYELLFTAPAAAARALERLAVSHGVPITPIGRIAAGRGVTVRDADGGEIALSRGGYRHF
ncbi:MAG TPA: thiamine-phosphate kinase [Stellaceae bacterium]|nr:thiamine-phosphate kinase [Stellaceae bacterium]